jgi:hypothetical protein
MTNSTDQSFAGGYRAVMTALFVGVADTLINLLFNMAYRYGGADFPQDFVNVSYLIFGTVFIFFLIGAIYTGPRILSKKGDLIFIALFAVITLFLFIAIGSAHLADSTIENERYRGMLRGLVLIDGITATALIPFFYNSPKFEAYVV